MLCTCPRRVMAVPRCSLGSHLVDDLLDLLCHRSQIGVLHVGLNVESRGDVVVRDVGGAGAARDRGHVPQQLRVAVIWSRAPACSTVRSIESIL